MLREVAFRKGPGHVASHKRGECVDKTGGKKQTIGE
jgi:hypothetical protein